MTIEQKIQNALKQVFLADDLLKNYPDIDVSDNVIDSGFFKLLVNPRNAITPGVPLYKCIADLTIATHLEDDKDRVLMDSLFDRIHGILINEQLLSSVSEVKAIQIDQVSEYQIVSENFQTITITLNIFIQL